MRRLRLALSTSDCGVLRRHRVDDRHLPFQDLLVEARIGDLVFHLGDAGIMPISPPMPPMLCICTSCSRSPRDRTRPAHLLGDARAFSHRSWLRPSRPATRYRPCQGCDPRCSTGGIPRARRAFRPVPISLDRLPVTARMESAAPPRPSPSTRVSTMPVSRRARRTSARGDGVLAGERIGHQQHLVAGRRPVSRWRLPSSSLRRARCGPRVEHHHVEAAEARGLHRATCDLRRRLAGNDRQRVDAHLPAEHRKLLIAAGGAYRARPSAPCACPARSAAAQLSRRGGGLPSPAGRPS